MVLIEYYFGQDTENTLFQVTYTGHERDTSGSKKQDGNQV